MAQYSPIHAVFYTFLNVLRQQGYMKLHTYILPDKVADAMQAVGSVSQDTLPTFCRDVLLRIAAVIASEGRPIKLDWQHRYLKGEVYLNLEMEAHAMACAFENWLEGKTTYNRDGRSVEFDERTFKLLNSTVH